MKIFQLKYLLILAVASMTLVQCDRLEDPDTPYEGEDFYRFDVANSTVSEDSPNPAMISVSYTSTSGYDAQGSVEFTVTSPNGAQEGVDYMLPNGNSLSFDTSSNFQDVAIVQPIDDDQPGENDTLIIELVNPANGRVGFPGPDGLNSSHRLVIVNDECPGPEFTIGGFYTAQSTGQSTDGCCPDEVTLTATVSIAPLGGAQYFLNDFSGGLYLEWYDVYGITSQDQSPIVFIYDPFAGSVVNEPGAAEPFGSEVTMTGTFDKCTGIIQYNWVNGFSDVGSITLTPM